MNMPGSVGRKLEGDFIANGGADLKRTALRSEVGGKKSVATARVKPCDEQTKLVAI